MKKYLASLVTGFGAGVLSVAPIIKIFSCCLIIPIAGIFAVILDQKANPTGEKIPVQRGIVLGLLTGLFAGLFGTFFEVLITFVTHSNDLVENLPQMKEMWSNLPQQAIIQPAIEMFDVMVSDIVNYGFSLPYSLFLMLNNILSGIIFGLLGGLIGMKIANTGIEKEIQ